MISTIIGNTVNAFNMLNMLNMPNISLLLICILFIVYVGIIIFIVYLFLAHRKIVTSIFEFNVLLCPKHSLLPFSINIFTSSIVNADSKSAELKSAELKSAELVCGECNEEKTFISSKETFFAKLDSITHTLQKLKHQLYLCTSRCLTPYKVKMDKYTWLCENTKQNWHILFGYPDTGAYKTYTQICKSYEYIKGSTALKTIDDSTDDFADDSTDDSEYTHSFKLELEDIEQVTKICELSNMILNMIRWDTIQQLDSNFTYMIALFKDIGEFINDLNIKCSSEM